MIRVIVLVTLSVLGAGCTTFPELEDASSEAVRAAPFPEFLPTDAFDTVPPAPELELDAFAARINALERRATLLRRPVLTSDERARLFDIN